MKQRRTWYLLAASGLLLTDCGRKPEVPAFSRFVIAPVEDLTSGDQLAWIPEALRALLASQLSASPKVEVGRARSLAETQAAQVAALPVYCRLEGTAARLTLHCWKPGGEPIQSSGPVSDGLAGLVTPVGRWLDAEAKPAPALKSEALKAYGERRYEDAVAIEPDFGLAYQDGAAAWLGGQREAAMRLIAAGIARGKNLDEPTQAQLMLDQAALSGDAKAQAAALERLSQLRPKDPVRLRGLVQAQLRSRQPKAAATTQARLTELLPADAAAWNDLGYMRVYAGDLKGAREALEKYRQLTPDQPNPLDSLGEVHFYAGDFAAAERYFLESFKKDPAFLTGQGMYKAALARLMAGDRAAADKHWKTFLDTLTDTPAQGKAFLQALWLYCSDRPAEAEAAMKEVKTQLAETHVALWSRLRGDSAGAQQALQRAFPTRQVNSLNGLLALFVNSSPASPAEWSKRAAAQFSDPRVRGVGPLALGTALLMNQHYAAAVELFRTGLNQAPISEDIEVRELLAWALTGAGQEAEAKTLLAHHGVPRLPTATPLAPILIRRAYLAAQKK